MQGFAQESADYEKYKKSLNYWDGYIIDKGGQKIEGLVKDLNEEKVAYQVVFVNKAGAKKKYKPSQIRGYGYSVYKYVSNSKIFLEVVSEGKRIGIYKALTESINYGGLSGTAPMKSQSEGYYFKKTNEVVFFEFKAEAVNSIRLGKSKKVDKKLVEYFSDCESLKTRIASGELTSNDYNKIAYHYNYDCQ
ncbi:MAG: hypothetical protein HOP30_08305 [Cyclobacteriaceae bacterium]|nr:hypothetical protein [Cyclobacteriaceae bacterium]